MIAVIAKKSEQSVVKEFFELFKTPWEFYQTGRCYDVVISSDGSGGEDVSTRLFLQCDSRKTELDEKVHSAVHSRQKGAALSLLGHHLPIYGDVLTFAAGAGLLTEQNSGKPVCYVQQCGDKTVARLGYDLFHEIEWLLTAGQPSENASVPALDLHIQLLRHLIVCSGIAVAEIPPAPNGYPFTVCLTHDLDHAVLRRHKFDLTILGFIYRATLGSAINVARGRLRLRKFFINCIAAAKLPFVYLGFAKDFWYDFDRYLEFEAGRPSTFFVVPFENHPGRSSNGDAPRARGTRYDVSHIAGKIPRLVSQGCEIALHGIDAWCDSSKGRLEAHRISEFAAAPVSGVRMHWLYSDENSPTVLEEAEFSYDSTSGYNNTVGYRAGTAQVFRPLNVSKILELPLNIMDSALFYPVYLNLPEEDAWKRIEPIFEHALQHGGAVTINWHDRSIAPERLWDDFYRRLLKELTARGAWFSTAANAVSWFDRRRTAVFELNGERKTLKVSVRAHQDAGGPGFRLRLHHPQAVSALDGEGASLQGRYTDTAFTNSIEIPVPM